MARSFSILYSLDGLDEPLLDGHLAYVPQTKVLCCSRCTSAIYKSLTVFQLTNLISVPTIWRTPYERVDLPSGKKVPPAMTIRLFDVHNSTFVHDAINSMASHHPVAAGVISTNLFIQISHDAWWWNCGAFSMSEVEIVLDIVFYVVGWSITPNQG